MILNDQHIHSNFSVDSEESIENMCVSAIKKGLRSITFTEHVDFNPKGWGYGFFNYEKYSEKIDSARNKFGKDITIFKGIEFGEPNLYFDDFNRLSEKDFDVVIASIHSLEGCFVGEEPLSKKYSLNEIFNKYYIEMLDAVKKAQFDILAHFDFPKRYYAKNIYDPLIEDILKELIKKGITLEINSSSLRMGLDECCPDRNIIERYIALGGMNFSAGSDAHCAEDIGAGFLTIEDLLKSFGITELSLFQKRKKVPVPFFHA
jgi:histidinol-phosphatase (PHP family)